MDGYTYTYTDDCAEVSALLGETIVAITGHENDDEILIATESGRNFKFYHEQDCCESCYVAEIVGDLQELVGSPLLEAEEISEQGFEHYSEATLSYPTEYDDGNNASRESYTWTFYKFRTRTGLVTVRWIGESNGYYSESVDFVETRRIILDNEV